MIKDVYLNLFTDFGFKKVFGEEPSKHLLVSFLNTLLPEKHQIASLEYTKNEYAGRSEFDRKAVIDLNCIAQSGEHFIIEVQKAKQHFFKDRSIYYSTFPIVAQAERGEWDYRLNHVYTIGLLNFTFDDDANNNDIVHYIQLKNQRNQVFYNKLTYIYVTLPRFTKPVDALNSLQDKWLYLFRHLHELDHIPEGFTEQALVEAFQIAEVAKLSPAAYAQYEDNLKVLRDLNGVMSNKWREGLAEGLEQGRVEGEAIGIQKGEAIGIQKGEAIGLEKGILEGKLTTARNLKALGLPLEQIAQATGLSIEVLQQLTP